MYATVRGFSGLNLSVARSLWPTTTANSLSTILSCSINYMHKSNKSNQKKQYKYTSLQKQKYEYKKCRLTAATISLTSVEWKYPNST